MRPIGTFAGLVLMAVSSVSLAQTAPQTFTLDGRLFSDTAATNPLVESGISFQVQILDPTQTCILYDEIDTVDTSSSDGYFTVQVGSATSGASAAKRGATDSGNLMATVYSNTITSVGGKLLSNGSACTYTPVSGDQRYVRMVVTPTSGAQQVFSPNMVLDSAPSAITAERADTIQGLAPNQLLQVNTTAPNVLSQSNLENIFSNTNYPILTSLLAGGANGYVATSSNGAVNIPTESISSTSGLTPGQMWYDSGSLEYYNGTSIQTLGTSGSGITSLGIGTGLTPTGTITSAGTTIAVNVGTGANQIVQLNGSSQLPAVDGSNLTHLSGSQIQSGTIGGSTAVSPPPAISSRRAA